MVAGPTAVDRMKESWIAMGLAQPLCCFGCSVWKWMTATLQSNAVVYPPWGTGNMLMKTYVDWWFVISYPLLSPNLGIDLLYSDVMILVPLWSPYSAASSVATMPFGCSSTSKKAGWYHRAKFTSEKGYCSVPSVPSVFNCESRYSKGASESRGIFPQLTRGTEVSK